MSKNAIKFNVTLQKEFSFLKVLPASESEVMCSLCDSKFSIANGGRRQIQQHVRTGKHIRATSKVANNLPMTSFLLTDPSQMQLSGKELTLAYHSAKHQMSGPTVDCNSGLIKQLFDSKFSCSAKKAAKLIKNVISPEIEREIGKSLSKLNFVTLLSDCSNRNSDKMLPVMARGFDQELGVVVFKLAVKLIPDEKSATIGTELLETGKRWKIEEKICAFGADNCNTNFGRVNRKGENNVFSRLKQELGREIVGIGCASHIIHNAFDSACDQLPINIEALAVNVFKHFRIHTLRVEKLKDFCEEAELEYSKLASHSGSRFLSLHPAVQKIIKMFTPLRNYFISLRNAPVNVKQFFEDKSGLFWLKFSEAQLDISNEYVLKTESKSIASFEVAAQLSELRSIIFNRKHAVYIPAEAAEFLSEMSADIQSSVKNYVISFYDELDSYLTKWFRSLDGTEVFSWLRLNNLPEFAKDVEPSIKFLQKHFSSEAVKTDKAFDEVVLLKQVVRDKLPTWIAEKTPSEGRWLEVIKTLNDQHRPINQISRIVEYAFSIPGTSTEVERLFSVINGIWSAEKGQLSLSTLEAHLNVKLNSNENCEKFYLKIKDNRKLLAQVQSSDKNKDNELNHPSTSTASSVDVTDLDGNN